VCIHDDQRRHLSALTVGSCGGVLVALVVGAWAPATTDIDTKTLMEIARTERFIVPMPSNKLFIFYTLNADRAARPVTIGVRRHADGTFLSGYFRRASGSVRIRLHASGEKCTPDSHDEDEPCKPCPCHILPLTTHR